MPFCLRGKQTTRGNAVASLKNVLAGAGVLSVLMSIILSGLDSYMVSSFVHLILRARAREREREGER